MGVNNYKELEVWRHSMDLVLAVYGIIDKLPQKERFALCDQLRRAVISVPSNIAEGFGRRSRNDFSHFLAVSRGSLFEVGTQLEIAQRLGYIQIDDDILGRIDAISRMLGSLIRKLDAPNPKAPTTKH